MLHNSHNPMNVNVTTAEQDENCATVKLQNSIRPSINYNFKNQTDDHN